jgi:cysteine dioxygenase
VGALLSAAGECWETGRPLISRAETYTRTCAYRDDSFEVVLLNWDRAALSPIHDHGDQHCWMMVLKGSLWVEDYVRLDAGDVPGYAEVQRRGVRALSLGDIDLRSGRFDLHRVAATGEPTVSLHLYCAPLREFLVYDESARRCETALGSYDDVLPVYSGSPG